MSEYPPFFPAGAPPGAGKCLKLAADEKRLHLPVGRQMTTKARGRLPLVNANERLLSINPGWTRTGSLQVLCGFLPYAPQVGAVTRLLNEALCPRGGQPEEVTGQLLKHALRMFSPDTVLWQAGIFAGAAVGASDDQRAPSSLMFNR